MRAENDIIYTQTLKVSMISRDTALFHGYLLRVSFRSKLSRDTHDEFSC